MERHQKHWLWGHRYARTRTSLPTLWLPANSATDKHHIVLLERSSSGSSGGSCGSGGGRARRRRAPSHGSATNNPNTNTEGQRRPSGKGRQSGS